MYRFRIENRKNNDRSWQADFSSMEEGNIWLAKQKLKAGRLDEREIEDNGQHDEEDVLSERFESLGGGNFKRYVTLQSESTYEIQDITIQYNQELTNAQARKYLADTDWYVVRFMETGTEIPEEISQQRQDAREAIHD